MAEKVKKWIIEEKEDGTLVFKSGLVYFHKDLAANKEKVLGGGIFEYDHEKKIFLLFGKSYDFGYCTIEQVKRAKDENRIQRALKQYNWYFGQYEYKHEVDTFDAWQKV